MSEQLQKEWKTKRLGHSIKLAVDVEALFKLYAYRIFSPEEFTAKMIENVQQFQEGLAEVDETFEPALSDERSPVA